MDGFEKEFFLVSEKSLQTRVARWFIFKPKIQIWIYFGGPWNVKCWYIL
jgi:hypothetical protein